MTKLGRRIECLAQLGDWLRAREDPLIGASIHRASIRNPWFTIDSINFALGEITRAYLNPQSLKLWLGDYPKLSAGDDEQVVGLILAGNIPLVGWHDIMCVYLSLVTWHTSRHLSEMKCWSGFW